MLHRRRVVRPPTPIAVWLPRVYAPSDGGLVIEIWDADPRLVIVPRLWIERAAEPIGDVSSGVTWTAYSATEGSARQLVALSALQSTANRPVRPASSLQADGVLTAGDNLELQASTPLLLGITIAAVPALPACGQVLWYSLECYPADTLPAVDELGGDLDGIMRAIRDVIPQKLILATQGAI